MSRIVDDIVSVPYSILQNFGLAQYYLIALIAVLVLIGIFASSTSTSSLAQRSQQKPIAPVVQPKAVPKPVLPMKIAPKITKVGEPLMNPKSFAKITKVAPVMNTKSLPSAAPAPAPPAKIVETVDSTFEAYRQAMLASGPRQMEEDARAELQSKGGASTLQTWREQTAALRTSLKDESAASFLERNNTSINDRMVAIFDAVKA